MNPKDKEQASVHNESLSLNSLVYRAKKCKQCACLLLIGQTFLCNWFTLQKQVRLLNYTSYGFFVKKKHQVIGYQYRRETVKQIF